MSVMHCDGFIGFHDNIVERILFAWLQPAEQATRRQARSGRGAQETRDRTCLNSLEKHEN